MSLAEALRYRALGCSVIPLRPYEKRPLVPWAVFQSRRANEEEIKSWWNGTPRAGVGIVCGGVSGLVALDIDPRNGGDVSLATREVPRGPTAQTGGGGLHYLMAIGSERIPKITGLLPGIDLQGEGSCIVMAPSIHPNTGQQYRWLPGQALGDVALPPMPSWLRRLVRDHAEEQRQDVRAASSAARGGLAEALAVLCGVRKTGRGWTARCPAHDDREPSLSIGIGAGGRVLFHCFAGCSFRTICQALEAARVAVP